MGALLVMGTGHLTKPPPVQHAPTGPASCEAASLHLDVVPTQVVHLRTRTKASEDGHVEVVVQQFPQFPGLLLPGLGDPFGEGLPDLLDLFGGEVVAPRGCYAA